MKRNKEEKEYNKKLLTDLFVWNKVSENEAIVTEQQLISDNYKGSLPYTTPTAYGNILIKQLPRERGDRWNTYSIFKM
jgi:hypothetical protein